MALKIDLGRDKLEVRFDHIELYEFNKLMDKIYGENNDIVCDEFDKQLNRCTVATIMINGNPIISGCAVCSYEDNFCKATGRKLSLSRAIKASRENVLNGFKLSKEVSKKIWQEYRGSCS